MPNKKLNSRLEHNIEKQVIALVEKQLKKANINNMIMSLINRHHQNSLKNFGKLFMGNNWGWGQENFSNSNNQIINILSSQLQRAIFRNL
jgi:hypothetical protein